MPKYCWDSSEEENCFKEVCSQYIVRNNLLLTAKSRKTTHYWNTWVCKGSSVVCELYVTTVEYLSINWWAETFGKKNIFSYTENYKLTRSQTPSSYWLSILNLLYQNLFYLFSSLNFLIKLLNQIYFQHFIFKEKM